MKVLQPAPPENLVTTPLMTASSLDSPLAPDLLLHTDEEAVVIPKLTCASGECLSCVMHCCCSVLPLPNALSYERLNDFAQGRAAKSPPVAVDLGHCFGYSKSPQKALPLSCTVSSQNSSLSNVLLLSPWPQSPGSEALLMRPMSESQHCLKIWSC